MPEYREQTTALEVPKNTGREGFLKALAEILRLPRVQSISINAKGQVKYTRYLLADDKPDVEIDFVSLRPYTVIQNSDVFEVTSNLVSNAGAAIASLFHSVAKAKLVPLAFASGHIRPLFRWHLASTRVDLSEYPDELYGLPLLVDESLPSDALFLLAGYDRTASITTTQKTYKVLIPTSLETP